MAERTLNDRADKKPAEDDVDREPDDQSPFNSLTSKEASALDNALSDFAVLERGVLEQVWAGNPLGYWEQWRHCGTAHAPVPEEVLSYFGSVADKLSKLIAKPPKRLGPALQNAFGLIGGPGAGSDFSEMRRRYRDAKLVKAAWLAVADHQTPGKPVMWAKVFRDVANSAGASPASVKRACGRFLGPASQQMQIVTHPGKRTGR